MSDFVWRRLLRRIGVSSEVVFLFSLLTVTALASTDGQFGYDLWPGFVVVTNYTGPGGRVDIPPTVDGLPVTQIGVTMFANSPGVVSVNIPFSVTNAASPTRIWILPLARPFGFNDSIQEITADTNNPAYSSLDGVLFNNDQTTLVAYPQQRLGPYVIPSKVTSLGFAAFKGCTGLTAVEIPDAVTVLDSDTFFNCSGLTSIRLPSHLSSIGGFAFAGCSIVEVTFPPSLSFIGPNPFECLGFQAYYFEGDPPKLDPEFPNALAPLSPQDGNPTVYYLPGNTKWFSEYAGVPTAIWKPQIVSERSEFGLGTNEFRFNVKWASGHQFVVEGTTNLTKGRWTAISTNAAVQNSYSFTDGTWNDFPQRFYRVKVP